jgi:hypothetical protein
MKTTKHSTDPKKISKTLKRKELNNEIAVSQNSMRMWPIPKELLINYGKDLLLMFEENEKMVTILKWLQKHKISHTLLDHYYKLCPELKEMVEEFRYLSGHRIFEKALYREADGNMATKGMVMYNQDYRQSEEWRNNLRKELNPTEDKQPINIYMTDFGSSGKVPDKMSLDKTSLDKTKKEVEKISD